MFDRTLLIIALSVAASGLLGLILLPVDAAEAASLAEEQALVEVEGVVARIDRFDGLTKISLRIEEELPVVLFENVTLEAGSHIRVAGEVGSYRGERQLEATQVTKLK